MSSFNTSCHPFKALILCRLCFTFVSINSFILNTQLLNIPVPKPVAFDIPVDETLVNGMDSKDNVMPKKLPPKRLLALAEQPSQPLTAKELSDKQLRAEEKRNELLGERKQKARNYNEKFLNTNNDCTSSNNSEDYLDHKDNNFYGNESNNETNNESNNESNKDSHNSYNMEPKVIENNNCMENRIQTNDTSHTVQ